MKKFIKRIFLSYIVFSFSLIGCANNNINEGANSENLNNETTLNKRDDLDTLNKEKRDIKSLNNSKSEEVSITSSQDVPEDKSTNNGIALANEPSPINEKQEINKKLEEEAKNDKELKEALEDNLLKYMETHFEKGKSVDYKKGDIKIIDNSISVLKTFLIGDLNKIKNDLLSIEYKDKEIQPTKINNKDLNELIKKKEYILSKVDKEIKDIKVKKISYTDSKISEKAINVIPSIVFVDKDNNEILGSSISIEVFPFKEKDKLTYKYRIR